MSKLPHSQQLRKSIIGLARSAITPISQPNLVLILADDRAAAVGVDRTYVGRMLRLTSLAPYIVQAIVEGNEPEGLSLEQLRKDLPVRWEEQRQTWRVQA